MLQNAYLLAKIGADTAENERTFAKNLQLPKVTCCFAKARLASTSFRGDGADALISAAEEACCSTGRESIRLPAGIHLQYALSRLNNFHRFSDV